jgi:hypothetical protein
MEALVAPTSPPFGVAKLDVVPVGMEMRHGAAWLERENAVGWTTYGRAEA